VVHDGYRRCSGFRPTSDPEKAQMEMCHLSSAYFMCTVYLHKWARSGVVVKALRYKLACRGFDSRECHWNFSVKFRSHYGPGADSASNRNEYKGYFLGVKADGA
jgi:hypothetical protein